RMQNRCDSNY
ncbi:outer membrane efflux family protein, partial [Vibrio parahaemolyticus V-223/04]